MNKSNSKCSSGCESGWTMYFDQSSLSARNVNEEDYSVENREESHVADYYSDLSMISDASSAPTPLHNQQRDQSFFNSCYSQRINKGTQKKKSQENRRNKNNSYLDDTASSPVFSFSHRNTNVHAHPNYQDSVEQDYSAAAPFKQGKSSSHKSFAASEKSGGLQGRKWH